ncbi:MAG TPA: peptidyl-prolyl cis-trans isomerase [Chryseosolibacter sp.]
MIRLVIFIGVCLLAVGCDFIKMRSDGGELDANRQLVAKVGTAYLYRDELSGIVPGKVDPADSAARVEAYVDSWVRKQLLIQEATKKIDINEAEVERKILDYRYSIIAYEYQTLYIKENLDTAILPGEIEKYYQENIDNFILKQNIVRATFLKVPKNAPQLRKVKDMIFARTDEGKAELKSFCLSFSAAYHISDSTWMIFDELVRNSPIVEIPNKVQFLKTNPYYETEDDNYLYFLKVDEYRISDNVSPLEFVRDEISNIILNKRKVELAKKLEDEVYNNALERNDFKIYGR